MADLVTPIASRVAAAGSEALEDRLSELSLRADPRIRTLVLEFGGVNFIDSQESERMTEILDLAKGPAAGCPHRRTFRR